MVCDLQIELPKAGSVHAAMSALSIGGEPQTAHMRARSPWVSALHGQKLSLPRLDVAIPMACPFSCAGSALCLENGKAGYSRSLPGRK